MFLRMEIHVDRLEQAQQYADEPTKTIFQQTIKSKEKGYFMPNFGYNLTGRMDIVQELRQDEKSPYTLRKKIKPRWFYHTPFGVPRGINPKKLRILAATWIVQSCISVYQSDIRSMKYDIIAKNSKLAKNKNVKETIKFVKNALESINYDGESIQDVWEKWIKDILEIDAGVLVSHYTQTSYVQLTEGNENMEPQRYVPEDVPPGNLIEVTAEDGGLFYKDFYDDGRLMGYWQHSYTSGIPMFFGKQEISYTSFNPSTYSPYGWSKVQQLYDILVSMVASVINTSDYTSRGSLPPGIIELRGADEDEAKAFRDYWRNKVQGSAYKFAIIGSPESGQINFIPLNFSIQDITFLEGLDFFWRIVMATFHIAPNELGITDTVNKSTSDSQERVIRRLQKVPMFTKLERIMNTVIVPNLHPEAHLIKFVWEVEEDIAKELQKEQLKTSQLARGGKTINELRIDAGDEPYDIPEANMPMNLLAMAQEQMPQNSNELGIDIASELQSIVQNIQQSNSKSLFSQKTDDFIVDDIVLSDNIDEMVEKQEKAIKTSIINTMKAWFTKITTMLKDFLTRNPEADINQGLLDTVTRITEPGNTVLAELRQTLEANLTEVFTNVWNMNADFTEGDGIFEVVPFDALKFVETHALLISEKLTTDLSQLTKLSVIDGLSKGESIPKIAARIEDVLKVSKRRAVTTARTETIRAMAESHHERIKQQGVERWQYFAHIDDRTCPICIALHKKTFAMDNKSKIPPRHPNCRCTILPVLDK